MEIVEYKGDFFGTSCETLLHFVSCDGAFDTAVGRQIAERYPVYAATFAEVCALGLNMDRAHLISLPQHGKEPARSIVSIPVKKLAKDDWAPWALQEAWSHFTGRIIRADIRSFAVPLSAIPAAHAALFREAIARSIQKLTYERKGSGVRAELIDDAL